MNIERRLIAALALPLLFACSDDGGRDNEPMFTSATAGNSSTTTDTDTDSMGSETSDSMAGDGDPAGDGDGDGPGDGDGDDPTTTAGDGDGDDPTDSGDGDGDESCGTDPALVGSSCGQGQGQKGPIPAGGSIMDLPVGSILDVDNGIGNGAEDWYQFEFPMDINMRPVGAMPKISFALNEGNDYRFEVYRDCGEPAYSQGLAEEFGASAPPLLEWSFFDLESVDEQANYQNDVSWPTTLWVRVTRFQNDGVCDSYQLQAEHL